MQGNADQIAVSARAKVEINGQYLPVKFISGSAPIAENVTTSTAPSQQISSTMAQTPTAWSELTLVAYITPDQKILADAMARVVNEGKNAHFQITITYMKPDMSEGKKWVYEEF